MTTRTPGNPREAWASARDLAGLHVQPSIDELGRELTSRLTRALPQSGGALLLLSDQPGEAKVELLLGDDCPLRAGTTVDLDSWDVPEVQRLPLRYREHLLGWLLLGAEPTPEDVAGLEALLTHYGVALANLTLNDDNRLAAESYCASLQTLEEGIVLFQEEDRDAVTARLIGLAKNMTGAAAGALYVLDEVGNADSDLMLTQALGMPEPLLEGFHCTDGRQWPHCLMNGPAFVVSADEDPSLGGLNTDGLPPILTNLAALPLRYHGVIAGICVLFNVAVGAERPQEQVDRMNRLGELGAALLHRLSLEAISVRNRDIETQLEIAETIQKGLLPSSAPKCDWLDFAWRSVAAQSIGGDYLDLVSGEGGHVHALIADASGHGINSALLMTSFRSAYRAEAPRHEPAPLLGKLNDEVRHEVGSTGMFITAATFRLEPDTGRVSFSSAGHNPVLLYRASTGVFEELDSSGPPLGFIPGVEYASNSRELQTGDVLFLYTDGITEATPANSEDMFGEERLKTVLGEVVDRTAAEILETVLERLHAFSGRTRYEDDVSLSVVKVH